LNDWSKTSESTLHPGAINPVAEVKDDDEKKGSGQREDRISLRFGSFVLLERRAYLCRRTPEPESTMITPIIRKVPHVNSLTMESTLFLSNDKSCPQPGNTSEY
jgi:hypothetical protein